MKIDSRLEKQRIWERSTTGVLSVNPRRTTTTSKKFWTRITVRTLARMPEGVSGSPSNFLADQSKTGKGISCKYRRSDTRAGLIADLHDRPSIWRTEIRRPAYLIFLRYHEFSLHHCQKVACPDNAHAVCLVPNLRKMVACRTYDNSWSPENRRNKFGPSVDTNASFPFL